MTDCGACAPCRSTRTTLSTIAPRLARARDQRVVELIGERRERLYVLRLLQHTEWRVAHRELQLARAGSTGNARYIGERSRKLARAQRELRQVQRWAERVGVAA